MGVITTLISPNNMMSETPGFIAFGSVNFAGVYPYSYTKPRALIRTRWQAD